MDVLSESVSSGFGRVGRVNFHSQLFWGVSFYSAAISIAAVSIFWQNTKFGRSFPRYWVGVGVHDEPRRLFRFSFFRGRLSRES